MRRLIALAALAAVACTTPAVQPSTGLQAAQKAMLSAAGVPLSIMSLPPPATAIQSDADGNMLFWTQAQKDARFKAMETLYTGTLARRGGPVLDLPHGRPLAVSDAEIDAYMREMETAGIVVVKDGKIRLERYARGFTEHDRYTSFSMAKSFTALLVGAAIKDGKIASVDDPLTRYIPELAGSAWDGVTLRHALTMTSGIRWIEDTTDPKADMSRVNASPPVAGEDAAVAYMRALPRAHPVGTVWNYSTGESGLIGIAVRRAVGKPLAQYLSEKVWKPAGMERDLFWMVNWNGTEMGGCCLSATLRDYARFGMFVMNGAGGILPDDYRAEMTKPLQPVGYPGVGYGYQWWSYPQGRYGLQGLRGQNVIVDPANRTVIAVNSAMGPSKDPTRNERRMAFLARLIDLAK